MCMFVCVSVPLLSYFIYRAHFHSRPRRYNHLIFLYPSLFPFSIPKKFLFYILTSECPLLNEGWGEKRGCVFNPITHFLYMYLLFLTKKFLGYFLISHLKPPLSVPPLYTKICPYNPMPLVAPLLSPPAPMPPLTFTLFNIEVPSN